MSAMNLIELAVKNNLTLEFTYGGNYRKAEPHVLGESNTGKFVIRAYQVGGISSGPIPSWRMFEVSKMSDVKILETRFNPRIQEGYNPNDSDMAKIMAVI